jgi:N-acetylneuraminate synthase
MLPNNPFIIGEIGINHNGDLAIAKQLIAMAKDCGANCVKFQKRDVFTVYSAEELAKPRKSPWGETQLEQKLGLEFTEAAYDEIDRFCKELGIPWFASAWDCKSQKFLQKYNLKYNKIASAMLTHQDLCEMVAKEGKYTFISTGGSTLNNINDVCIMFEKHNTPYCLLHCISVYPCEDSWCNIRMIETLKDTFKGRCDVGYSGHEMGLIPSVLAVALGAVAIERHITLSRTFYGSDQAASLEREGLARLVRDCRDVKKMLGTGEKMIIPEEEKVMHKLRYWKD